jgi:aryl-alcohol dehydrogenase-like predicted oxidoreductase
MGRFKTQYEQMGPGMRKQQLGNTDLEFTRVGLGTWAIGGGDWRFGWGPQDEQDAVDAILRAVELGINWVDTAPVYGDGNSERLVGRALRQLEADRPYVATKFGRVIQLDGSIGANIKRASIISECEASLERLGVEAIDLYQMHWPDPEEDIEEAWKTMCDLKSQGKVRHIGVSNHNVAQLRRLGAIHEIASLQPPYSMVVPGIEAEILPYCGEHNIGVICYSPMCKGLLSGKFNQQRAAALPDSDHRSRDPKFSEPQLSINLALADGLAAIAQRAGRSVAELAIAWTLRRDEVTAAIVGARDPAQIEGTAGAADWQFDASEQEAIDALLAEREAKLAALGPIDTGRV